MKKEGHPIYILKNVCSKVNTQYQGLSMVRGADFVLGKEREGRKREVVKLHIWKMLDNGQNTKPFWNKKMTTVY